MICDRDPATNTNPTLDSCLDSRPPEPNDRRRSIARTRHGVRGRSISRRHRAIARTELADAREDARSSEGEEDARRRITRRVHAHVIHVSSPGISRGTGSIEERGDRRSVGRVRQRRRRHGGVGEGSKDRGK